MSTITVYFDLETGGTQPSHPIIQIAAIAIDSNWKELGSIEMKLKFDPTAADPEALKINHYSPEAWAEAISPGIAVGQFAHFLEPYKSIPMVSKRTGRPYSVAQLAGHNVATFDAPRLQALFKRFGAFLPADPRVLDTLQRAMWWFHERGIRPPDFKLATLCDYFKIPVADAHDALGDVRLTIKLAHRLAEYNGQAPPEGDAGAPGPSSQGL